MADGLSAVLSALPIMTSPQNGWARDEKGRGEDRTQDCKSH